MKNPILFYRGDVVSIKRGRKKQWNAHCTVDRVRCSGSKVFTVLDVYEPANLRIPPPLHPQWIVYDDGSDVPGMANASWFTHSISSSR